MANDPQKEAAPVEAPETRGAKIAREGREAANSLTDAEREALDVEAMRLFYGGKNPAKVRSDRG